MLTKLKILESHLTAGSPLQADTRNLLEKYRKMSSLDLKALDEIYYLGNKETVEMFEATIRYEKVYK